MNRRWNLTPSFHSWEWSCEGKVWSHLTDTMSQQTSEGAGHRKKEKPLPACTV